MNREDRQELYKLIEQWTRAEIMARFGPFWPQCGQYALDAVELIDKIRVLMYGTKDLVELGTRWGILKTQQQKQEVRTTLTDGSQPKTKLKGSSNGSERRGSGEGHRRKPLL